MSTTHIIDHPLAQERLTRLRDKLTDRPDFRRALRDISGFIAYEALRDIEMSTVDIDTPVAPTIGTRLTDPPLLVPVMRAGLGMLDAVHEIVPEARVGFVGLRRDEETLLPHAYVNTVPDDLAGRHVVVLDPMLATGGSLIHTCELLRVANAGKLTVLCVLAAPEGIKAFEEADFEADLYTASVDERLNEVGFIVPGLGDAGDRQFGLN